MGGGHFARLRLKSAADDALQLQMTMGNTMVISQRESICSARQFHGVIRLRKRHKASALSIGSAAGHWKDSGSRGPDKGREISRNENRDLQNGNCCAREMKKERQERKPIERAK